LQALSPVVLKDLQFLYACVDSANGMTYAVAPDCLRQQGTQLSLAAQFPRYARKLSSNN
jgi:hypothetical protein